MNILVTGARAPATMDQMRSLISQGHRVYCAESMLFPVGRFVAGITKYFIIPKPNDSLAEFLTALKKLIITYKIDILIPTCEEIFHVSQGHEELSKYTRVFCEPIARLNELHDKFAFNQLVREFGLDAPESWLLNNDEDKKNSSLQGDLVLKPIFSRFGARTIIKPTQAMLEELAIKDPHIAQRFITGTEYSTYSIVEKGEVLIESCYYSKYVAGRSTGIYFKPANIKPITEFIKQFCRLYQFSGQIAFDFIVKDDKAYVLECNPRVTSGFHLLADHIDWAAIFAGRAQKVHIDSEHPLMLKQGMILHSFKYMKQAPALFIKDYRSAHDVLKNKAYPLFGLKSILALLNVLGRVLKTQKGFYPASTYDIDFNGLDEIKKS